MGGSYWIPSTPSLPQGENGYSPDLTLMVPFLDSFAAKKGSYSNADFAKAIGKTDSPVYKQAFWSFYYFTLSNDREITTEDLQTVAGHDSVFDLEELQDLFFTLYDTLPQGESGYSPDIDQLKTFLANFTDGETYTASILHNAVQGTKSPIYKKALEELKTISLDHSKPITFSELKVLAGSDPLFDLSEIKELPKVSGWKIPDPFPQAQSGYSPDLNLLIPFLNNFSNEPSKYTHENFLEAANATKSTIYSQALIKLAEIGESYNRPITEANLRALGGNDPVFDLGEIGLLPKVTGWVTSIDIPVDKVDSPDTAAIKNLIYTNNRSGFADWAKSKSINDINKAVAALSSAEKKALISTITILRREEGKSEAHFERYKSITNKALTEIIDNPELGFYAEVLAYTPLNFGGTGFNFISNENSLNDLTVSTNESIFAEDNPRNLFMHELYHSFNHRHNLPIGTLDEGTGVFIYKAAFPEEFSDSESWSEAAFGSKLYVRDLPPSSNLPLVAVSSRSNMTPKGAELFEWLSAKDTSQLPWDNQEQLDYLYSTYWEHLDRGVSESEWKTQYEAAHIAMLQDPIFNPAV